MIDRADQELQTWIQGIVGDAEVRLEPPEDGREGRGVSCYLLEVAESPLLGQPASADRPAPLQLSLRYLISAWSQDPADSHRLLGEIAFALLEHADYEMNAGPPSPDLWVAFGVLPRPGLILRASVRRERPRRRPKVVRSPLVLASAPITDLHGVVVGPQGMPIASARVEVPALQKYQYTDRKGRFRFTMVPVRDEPHRLCISARGKETKVSVQKPEQDEPIVIEFDLFEEE